MNLTDPAPAQTAELIRFPARPKPATVAAPGVSPEVRLARALKSLSVALAEQRVVLTAWRNALGELKTTTTGLADSLTRYRTNLGVLDESVLQLKVKAQALHALADIGSAGTGAVDAGSAGTGAVDTGTAGAGSVGTGGANDA